MEQMTLNKENIIKENEKRRTVFKQEYDPLIGLGSPIERELIYFDFFRGEYKALLPKNMFNKKSIELLHKYKSVEHVLKLSNIRPTKKNADIFFDNFVSDRLDNDFEFWSEFCAKIRTKTGDIVPFILNRPQRKLLKSIYKQIQDNKPIRQNLLKARQWGGTTESNMFQKWVQARIMKGWNSAIVTDSEPQARHIRGMGALVDQYYPELCGQMSSIPYQGSKHRYYEERECIVATASYKEADSLRAFTFQMTHLSEVGSWRNTPTASGKDLAQALSAAVPKLPWTMCIRESTAKGVGNFWHQEWLASVKGESDYVPVFIPWFEIDEYQEEIEDYYSFIDTLTDKEKSQWETGATLEGILWYRNFMKGNNYDQWRMDAEFPGTPEDAFQSTGSRVFSPLYVSQMRKYCRAPEFVGDIYPLGIKGKDSLKSIDFQESPNGSLLIWEKPGTEKISNRYVTSMDIGGRTQLADFSHITQIDRAPLIDMGVPVIVADWHGHLDQDLLAWHAARIAKYYNDSLLVVESNSLRQKGDEENHGLTILNEIADYYNNIYCRTSPEDIQANIPKKYGFHTNKLTKQMIVDALNGFLRDLGYYERNIMACDEYDVFEIKPDGTMGAKDGCHDDILMSRAIGLYVAIFEMEMPKLIVEGASKPIPRYKTNSMAEI